MEKFIVTGLSAIIIVTLFFIYDVIKNKIKQIILSKKKK